MEAGPSFRLPQWDLSTQLSSKNQPDIQLGPWCGAVHWAGTLGAAVALHSRLTV